MLLKVVVAEFQMPPSMGIRKICLVLTFSFLDRSSCDVYLYCKVQCKGKET